MIIKHKIDSFLFEILPLTKGLKPSELENYFCAYYCTGIYKPTVKMEGDSLVIEKENYAIPLIPNKTFIGKQFLSWLYVSWAIRIPEHLGKMGLKFEREYEVAKSVGKV